MEKRARQFGVCLGILLLLLTMDIRGLYADKVVLENGDTSIDDPACQ